MRAQQRERKMCWNLSLIGFMHHSHPKLKRLLYVDLSLCGFLSLKPQKIVTKMSNIPHLGQIKLSNTWQSKTNVCDHVVCFSYVYRSAAVRTTGCLGGKFELMSLWDGIQADTDTQPYHGIQSSPQSPGHSQCLLGFHSDQLKDKNPKSIFGCRTWSFWVYHLGS